MFIKWFFLAFSKLRCLSGNFFYLNGGAALQHCPRGQGEVRVVGVPGLWHQTSRSSRVDIPPSESAPNFANNLSENRKIMKKNFNLIFTKDPKSLFWYFGSAMLCADIISTRRCYNKGANLPINDIISHRLWFIGNGEKEAPSMGFLEVKKAILERQIK